MLPGAPAPRSPRAAKPRAAEPVGGACHAQMYTMGTLLKHGSEEQKRHYLPKIASGELRLQAFGVTEPGAGTDTTRISTFARREGDDYVVNGQKIWISRAEHSDLMVLLCRTTPREECAKPSDGMSVLLVDMREAVGNGLTIRPVRTMLNHATTELFFDDLRVPASALIGEEGNGFELWRGGLPLLPRSPTGSPSSREPQSRALRTRAGSVLPAQTLG